MENTAIFKIYSELGNQISTRGAASLNCETLASPIVCLYKSSELNIDSYTIRLWKHTKSQRGNTSE